MLAAVTLCFAARSTFSQEICDNGKDDDGNGLIDLKDPHCQCKWKAPYNLLLNPSFEEFEHCMTPGAYYSENYNLLKNWVYGVLPNGDINFYKNFKCPDDSLFLTVNYVPRPIPDGSGFLLMMRGLNRTILYNTPESTSTKRYVAQCLQAPLQKGKEYTFSFYGAQYYNNGITKLTKDSFTVAVFGHADCNAVPFGRQQGQGNGCPANYPGWVMLGKTTFVSSFDWVQAKMELNVPQDINVIEVGADCSMVDLGDTSSGGNAGTRPYYYLDDFQLAETRDFHFQHIQQLSGDPCRGGYVLKAPVVEGARYQWYQDSIALVGQTDSTLHIAEPSTTAYYNVRVTKDSECRVSEPLLVKRSTLSSLHLPLDTVACSGETVRLGTPVPGVNYSWSGFTDTLVKLAASGQYTITAIDSFGCKSDFSVRADFKNCMACRAYVPNAFTPNGDGKNDELKVSINCPVRQFHFQVYNRWGQKVFETAAVGRSWDGTFHGKKLPSGVYVYELQFTTINSEKFIQQAKGTLVLIE